MTKSPIALMGIIPIFIGGIAAAAAASSDIGKSYHVYHRLGNDSNLTPRGTITIAPPEEGIGLEASFQPDSSARLDIAAFDGMVENGALYTIVVLEEGDNKASSKTLSYPPSNAKYVLASVPGCSLRRSNLKEEIGLSIGPTGRLLSVSYRPLISALAAKTCQNLKPLSDGPEVIFGRRGDTEGERNAAMPFKTTVSFDSHEPMMAIPTVLPKQKPPPGLKWYRRNAKNNPNPLLGGANAKNEGGIPGLDDEPPSGLKASFLYRYWYIILPMALMGLFGGVDEEQAKAQAGGGGGAAVAGAVAAGGATHASKRRGKRD